MKAYVTFLPVMIGIAVLCLLVPQGSVALPPQAACPDVAARGSVNVLTLNMLFFSPVEGLQTRVERMAKYITSKAEHSDPIDVILLQEVTGGDWSGTNADNSSRELHHLLQSRGLSYNLRYRLETGIPVLLTVGNAILSRCKILVTLSHTLPTATEDLLPINGLEVPIRRIVLMSRIAVPGYGKLHVYNTHLCAACAARDFAKQTAAMLAFVAETERAMQGKSPLIILGGDLNLDQNLPAHHEIYTRILNASFTDTYATRHGCVTCCSPAEGDAGCTYGDPRNPFVALNPFSPDAEPARLDYLFVRATDNREAVQRSTVVLKGDHLEDARWVSDHVGVLSRIRLGE
jgi:maltose 6'-phosphate phosphatase